MGGRGAGSGSRKASAKSYYDYDDRSDSNAVLSADGETWWNSLTQKNKEFFDFYTGSGYTGFNEAARAADGDSKKMTKYGKRLDTAIETLGRGNLDRNMIFNRQSTLSLLGLKKGASDAEMQACVGKVVVDHGITSTRASKYHNDGKGMFGNTNYHIKTPSGKGIGAYIANHSACGKGEDEFLFRPGSAYRVDKFYKDSHGNPHFDMTYMGNVHEMKKNNK